MVSKTYEWEGGAALEPHTERKLKVLREYFETYLRVRCQIAQQTKFRLAVVDGFAGGGRYSKGEPGSPIVFVEVLGQVAEQLNIERAAQGMAPLEIECRLILNDFDTSVIELLKENLAPVLAAAREKSSRLRIIPEFMSVPFEAAYPDIRAKLLARPRFRNVLFNLDQCGDTHVTMPVLNDIMRTFEAGEVFLTFMIKSLMTYLKKNDKHALQKRLDHIGISADDLAPLDGMMANNEWLGVAERIVFDAFKGVAPFTSPFSLINPIGWRYWLIHFSNVARARQVYNDILHANASQQAHFGRSGLNMFSYDPAHEGTLCLFEEAERGHAREELITDIPRLVSEYGDVISVNEFYHASYNLTPAHSDDIKAAMLGGDEMEVLTPNGNPRRKPNKIGLNDVLKLKPQKSFHLLW